ncbi:unnamed protein product [Calypogeia fissa]
MNACATRMNSGLLSLGVIGLEERSLVVGQSGDGWSSWKKPESFCCSHFPKRRSAITAIVSVRRFGKFRRGAALNLVCAPAAGLEQQRLRRTLRHAIRSKYSTWESFGVQTLQLDLVAELGYSKTRRKTTVRCSVGVAPLEEPKPDAEDHTQEHHSINSSGVLPGENFLEKPAHVSHVPEEVLSQVGGKAGFISFYEHRSELVPTSPSKSNLLSLIWPLGPFILVASVVFPPLYLRKIFGAVLEDSLVTDFVILFFTETLFFIGASIFLYVAHISRQATAAAAAASSTLEQTPSASPVYSLGYRLSAKVALGIGVLLPIATFVMVWPWTGPAAAAALAPYMIGLLVQLGFENIVHTRDSPVWPLVPVTFQMYRLHQLNRAAQLVAGLLFSLKGVEATAETMAINGSLQTLLFVLQVLGMLCLWSLGSFLTNQLPSKRGQTSIPSIP